MPIFVFFVIFCIWLSYELKKNTNIASKNQAAFWQAESDANATRKKDIANLDYIQLNLSKLPFDNNALDPIKGYQEAIDKLSGGKLLNLNGISNTTVKATYGPANFETLSTYDSNYTKTISTLAKWGEALYQNENYTDAQSIFEYSIDIGSDIKKVFILLANIYYEERNFPRIESLIMMANQLNSITKDSTVKELKAIYKQR